MPAITRLDAIIKYLVLAFAAVMGFTRGGIHTVVWLLTVAAIVRYAWRPFPILPDKNLQRAVLVFFAALLLAAAFSGDKAASLKFIGLTAVKFLPLVIVVAFVRERKLCEQATLLMAGSMLLGSAIVIWQGLHGVGRVNGLRGVMDFAGIVGLMIPMLLVKGLEENTASTKRLLFLTAAAAAMAAMMFNGTRAVWVTVVVTCVLYVIISLIINGKKSIKVTSIVCAMLLIIALTFACTPSLNARLHTITDTSFRSNRERIVMWQYAVNVFKDHTLLGVGPATLPALAMSPAEEEKRKYKPYGHVHNNVLQLAAESGIIGGLAYFFLFFTILKNAAVKMRQVATRSWALIAFLCTTDFLLHGMFDYILGIPTIMYSYWLIIGLAYVNFSTEKQ